MTKAENPGLNERRHTRLFVRGLLILVFVLLLLRLVGFAVTFMDRTVQMDFAAFYTAGESLNAGLSPYVNHIDADPMIWDGVSGFAHSRFLYPPLAARPFQLVALAPYYTAKLLWMVAATFAMLWALVLAFRYVGLTESTENLLTVAIITIGSHPFLTMLERGQIDSMILLVLLVALSLARRNPRSQLVSGALIALATLMKLHVIFLVPFLLIRKRWRPALGFAAAGLVLLGLSLVVDGPKNVSDYAFNQLPRIAEYGEGGTPAMALPRESFELYLAHLSPGFTPKQDRTYRRAAFRFVLNASLVQAPFGSWIRNLGKDSGVPISPTILSLAFLAAFLLLVYFWQRRYGSPGDDTDPTGELIYWQLALTIILITSPVSWTMTTVWLLPISIIILRVAPVLRSTAEAVALLACALGLLALTIPDPYASYILSPYDRETLDQKYLIGEFFCLIGLLGLWRERAVSRDRSAA